MVFAGLAFVVLALVVEVQADALVQECQFAQAVGQDVVFVFRREREDALVGFERDGGAAVGAFADDLDLRRGGALAVTVKSQSFATRTSTLATFQVGQLCAGHLLPVGDGAHDRAHGQAVEVVVHKDHNGMYQHGEAEGWCLDCH